MIILNKKRIAMMASVIMVAICTFIIQTAQVKETVQTVALPASSKVIVLDAGHRWRRSEEQLVAME